MGSRIKDAGLADNGRKLLSWAEDHMPVVMRIRERFSRERPLLGIKVAACLHVTKETGVLVRTLMEGGAEVALAGSNPLSTQDEVASALSEEGAEVFAWRGQSKEEYYGCLEEVASRQPDLTMDD
ncbi:MAG: adenosylhomocysteinase, partial [Candidatus Verstraetearchaeota archaeon]|nr:adenosylhomocysteinase [Candidatus Verstraetearchaeota archaeon]